MEASHFGGKKVSFADDFPGLECTYIYVHWMASPTPFFTAFRHLLFGKPRLSAIQKLLRDQEHPHSLSQYQEAFGEFIPQALLAPAPKEATVASASFRRRSPSGLF